MGQTVSGSARLSLRDMFPNATEEQLKALNEGKPVPPSADWLAANHHTLPDGVAVRSEAGPAGSDPPLVTCVMVFGDDRRLRIARKAVNQFVAQTYERKQLVIVNATVTSVTNVPHSQIREVRVSDVRPSIGSLRNRGLAEADGDWVRQWDDDDSYDPLLLSYQMGVRLAGHATLLTHQIRFHIDRSIAYLHRQPEGIAGTILFPKLPGLKYEDISFGEDRAFWIAHFGSRTHLADNSSYPASCLHMAAYHGLNATPVEQFMVDHHGPDNDGRILLPAMESKYFAERLSDFGLSVRPRSEAAV